MRCFFYVPLCQSHAVYQRCARALARIAACHTADHVSRLSPAGLDCSFIFPLKITTLVSQVEQEGPQGERQRCEQHRLVERGAPWSPRRQRVCRHQVTFCWLCFHRCSHLVCHILVVFANSLRSRHAHWFRSHLLEKKQLRDFSACASSK